MDATTLFHLWACTARYSLFFTFAEIRSQGNSYSQDTKNFYKGLQNGIRLKRMIFKMIWRFLVQTC